MGKLIIDESTLTSIGNAIREKEGSTELVPVTDMAERILALSGEISDEQLNQMIGERLESEYNRGYANGETSGVNIGVSLGENALWDKIQANGTRTRYEYAFQQSQWIVPFNPKYPSNVPLDLNGIKQ